MLHRIDNWLIGRCEKLSHFSQRLCGMTSATWERICLVFALVLYVFQSTVAWRGPGIVLHTVMILSFLDRMYDSIKRTPSTGEEAVSNPAKPRKFILRMFFLATALMILPLSLYDGEFLVWFEFSAAALYFECCDDLPLGISKLKEWLKKVSTVRRLVPARTRA